MKNKVKLLKKYLYRKVWKEKYVTLDEVCTDIRKGKYQKRVDAVRGLTEVPSAYGMIAGESAAESLPQVFPSKGEKGAYTGLVLLSFHIEQGLEQLEKFRKKVNGWEQTLLSFVGIDGRSLKVLMPYRLAGGTLPVEDAQVLQFQRYAYKRAAEFALASTGFRADEVSHDGSEFFYLSADPEVYYCPDARPVEIAEVPSQLTEEPPQFTERPPEAQLDAEVLPGYSRREMDIVKFNAICRNLAFRQQREKELYLMKLATECRKAGIDQELAIKLVLDMWAFYGMDVLVRSTFSTAYGKHPMGLANPIEKSLMHQVLLQEFLHRRYMFRRNRVTGDLEYQEKGRYELWWKPLTEEARNDINNAAILEGIKVWPKDLNRVLVSERINSYDPVNEWLMSLPKWDGRDRLGEMADRVKTETPEWRDNFKIWMRSMVSQWRSGVDAMYGAQMVLMLVGDQGTRKSTFMRMLLPKELMPFYIDRIDFANRKEALRALSRFLLINIDEYDQISKTQTAFLKHLIQRTDVKERKLYSTTYEQQQRYAAFCATTNSLVPLRDESGSRRYLVVEVSGVVDTDTQGDRDIDYAQLYAQIVYEIEHGEEFAFKGEREQKIIEQNADYYDMPNVVSIFEDYYHRPNKGENVVLMSPTEIVRELKLDPTNRSNVTLLGLYLRKNGFKRGDGRQRRYYEVAKNEP